MNDVETIIIIIHGRNHKFNKYRPQHRDAFLWPPGRGGVWPLGRSDAVSAGGLGGIQGSVCVRQQGLAQ